MGTTDATVCGSYELAKMGENGETHATCITKVSETKFGAKIKYIDNSDFESNPATSADVSLDGSTGNANYASQKHHMVLRTKYSDTAENHYQYKDKENFTISVSGADGASTDTLTGSTYKTNGVIDAYIAKADLCKTKTNKGQSINTSQKTVLVRFTPTASTGDLSEISIPVMSRIWTFDGVNEGGKYSDNKQVRALSIYGSQDSLSVRSIKNKNAGDFISTTAGDNTFEVSVKNNTKVPQMVDVKYFATNDSDANVFTVGNYTDTLTGSVSIEGGKTLKFETSNLNGTSLSDGSDAFIHVGVFVGSDLIHTNTIKTVSRDPGSKMLLSWTKQFSSSTSANGSSVNFSAMIFNTGTKSYTGSLSLYASKDAACNSSDTLISQQDVKIIQPGKKKSLRFSKSKIFDVLSPSEYITICADITDGVSSTTWNWNIYDKKNKENPTAESGVISSGKQTLNTFDDLEGPDYFIPTGTF
ncbi:MAG: hypothetical protein U9Q15_03245 [Patescibacteria group bacterium]|nr:hypothetical protein [Patescibacteria group bacterium]